MEIGAVAFYVVATATVVASLGVVLTRSVVYSALLLVGALALTGLIYLLLFALMLTRPRETLVMNHRGWPLAALGALATLGAIVFGVVATDWAGLTPKVTQTALTAATPASATSARTTTELLRIGPEQLGSALRSRSPASPP